MRSHLYYEDAYTTEFTAQVVERIEAEENGRYAVILDGTYFYPDSGGQPHDEGRLNGRPVVDVTEREADGAILHWLKAPLSADAVQGEIDWARRFDHMQQHTGQHILSQAFIRATGATTASFHLGSDAATIDLATDDLTPGQAAEAETLANQIVWEDRPVRVRMATPQEAEALDLRKIPPPRNGRLRLIEIEDFDRTACGGTHVARTGEVGMIKVVKTEPHRGRQRVTFLCGQRALQDYEQKHAIITDLIERLTTADTELAPAVERLQNEVKELGRTVRRQEEALLAGRADRLWQEAEKVGIVRVITAVFTDLDPDQMRVLAAQLRGKGPALTLLGCTGDQTYLLFSRTEKVSGAMNALIRPALERVGGRGGGSPTLAQGGGPPAAAAEVRAALEMARERWAVDSEQ